MTAEKADSPVKTEAGVHGRVLLAWETVDRPRYERGRLWYAVMGLAGLALLLYAVITANFLFALIIIMFALVLYVSSLGEPRPVNMSITEDGVEIGQMFYPFREIDRFWFYYEPPEVKSLYLEFKNLIQPRLTVHLMDQNPNAVRGILSQFLKEDVSRTDEPLSEMIGRMFKI